MRGTWASCWPQCHVSRGLWAMFLSSTLAFSSLQSATYHAGCCCLSPFLPFFFTEHSRLCSVSLLARYPSRESCTGLEHICGVGLGPLVQEALSTRYPPERLSFQAPGSSAPYAACEHLDSTSPHTQASGPQRHIPALLTPSGCRPSFGPHGSPGLRNLP